MKRTIATLLALLLCFGSLAGCSAATPPSSRSAASSALPTAVSSAASSSTLEEPEFVVPTDEEIRSTAVEIDYELAGNSSSSHSLGYAGYVDALVTYVRPPSVIGSIWLYVSYPSQEGYETKMTVVNEEDVSPEAFGQIAALQPDAGVRLYYVMLPSGSSIDDYFHLMCVEEIEQTFTNADVRASYETQCTVVPYKDILRSSDTYARTRMAVRLKVSQVMDGGFRCYAVDESGRQLMDEEWYLVDTRYGEEPKLLETDVLQVYGAFIELVGVTRALTGATDEIPKIQGTYIDILE